MTEPLQRALRAAFTAGDPPPDAQEIALTARRMVTELAGAATPLIGEAGFRLLLARSAHLIRRQHDWLVWPAADSPGFEALETCLRGQEPQVAADATLALFGTLTQLLTLFIGESLTTPLLRRAWPGVYVPDRPQESPHD